MPIDYETKIISVGEAAREFLTIVIGLALAYAIATRAPEIPGVKDGNLNLFQSTEVGALFVYIFYATRFYVNNWLYLAESYDQRTIESKKINDDPKRGRRALTRVYLDLILTIYTAIIISIVPLFGLISLKGRHSPTLLADRLHHVSLFLMLCLIAHYIVDAAALAGTTAFSQETTPLNRLRSRAWICNNLIFIGIFCIDINYKWLLEMLLLNCIIAVMITVLSPLIVKQQ